MYYNSITELIGKTPLLKLRGTNIFAKLEYFNPLHSVKDRPAYYMLKDAEAKHLIEKAGTIIEPTSGNTGIGLTYIAKQMGYNIILTMPESMSAERVKLMQILGAKVILTDKSLGIKGSVSKAMELLENTPNSYMPNQFENENNIKSHLETTSREIITDLGDVVPDYLVLTIGSAGTIMGIGKSLKLAYPNLKIIAVEPFESPLLSQGKAAPHGIMGIGANFIPPLLDTSILDEIITVKSEEAKEKSLFAAKQYGTLVGISSGAALHASLQICSREPNAVIITLFPDTGERYLSVL